MPNWSFKLNSFTLIFAFDSVKTFPLCNNQSIINLIAKLVTQPWNNFVITQKRYSGKLGIRRKIFYFLKDVSFSFCQSFHSNHFKLYIWASETKSRKMKLIIKEIGKRWNISYILNYVDFNQRLSGCLPEISTYSLIFLLHF